MSDAARARSGSRLLQITYNQGGGGGWLTRFFMPGYDSVYVRYYVRFPANWLGSTKLLGLYGSRSDNQWSGMGQAGKCPNGTDFFSAMLVTEHTGASPGPTRFYTYHPGMAKEPDGVTCWGRYGDGTERYVAPLEMSLGAWHKVEFWVKLNAPGQRDAVQRFWVDGVLRGEWSGFSLRTSSILTLNALQISASVSTGAPQTQALDMDDVLILKAVPPGT
ncbi:MAG: polysaccharide lyase [Gemmatimonadaceae bacterium]